MENRKVQRKMLRILKIIITLTIVISLGNGIVKSTDDIVIPSENWNEWQNEYYWEWHTRTTTDDQAYNGKHIEINNDVIDFYGYWENSYKDFLYKQYENPGKKIFKFRIDESKANYHTLDGAGFIFNANKENDKLSGYILLFREKDICIYRIEDVDINTFETTADTTVATYGELIESKPKTNSAIHDLIVEATPTNIKVTEGDSEILNVKLDYSKHAGEGFGLISSYVQHSCSILSQIEFSELKITIEDYNTSILNTDMDNNPIQGGYFEVKDNKGNIIKEGKTDKDGKIYIDSIGEGIYTIEQKVPPTGYIINKNIYKFKVTEEGKVVDIDTGEEIKLIVKNEKTKIEINNKLKNSETPIPGSKIGLYDKDGKQVATAVTDKDGKAIFTGIEKGAYTYKQLEVPNGYVLNTNEYTCTIDENGNITFSKDNDGTIYNERKKENSTINKDSDKSEKDNTKSNIPIPKAGLKTKIIIISIIISIIFGTFIAIKLKEYKIVK